MTVNDPQLVTVLVLIMAAFVLIQTIFVAYYFLRMEKRLIESQKKVDKLAKSLGSGLQQVHSTMEALNWIPKQLPVLEETVNSMTEGMTEGIERINARFEEGITVIMEQIDQVSRRIDYGLTHFTRQTSRIARGVFSPAANVSAVIHGIVAGIRTFRGDDEGDHRPLQDDERFI